MGATNNIKGTNISLQLAGKECSQCNQKFTEQEIDDRNFDIWFDTTNDVKLIDLKDITKEETKNLYFPIRREGFMFTIWIRSIEHEDCPERLMCWKCGVIISAGHLCADCAKKEFKDNE